MEIHSEPSSRQSSEIARLEDVPRGTHMTSLSTEGPIHTEKSSEEYETTIAQLQSDYKVSETRRQEETHTFIERIDALQSKLQYLTKEAEASAKAAIIAAPVGSLNRSLAEKDQQIALLMEEGAKLSKVELRHMNTIKKLRTSILHDQRRAEEARKEIDAARQAVQEAKDKCKRAEEAERRGIEKIKPLSLMERDYEALKFEFDSQNATVIDLRTQLVQATSKAKATNTKALSDVLDAEKKVSAKLRDDLARATAERDASEGKLGSEIRSMKDEAERERARASVTETELRREQSVR